MSKLFRTWTGLSFKSLEQRRSVKLFQLLTVCQSSESPAPWWDRAGGEEFWRKWKLKLPMSSSPDWPDALLAPFPPKTPSLTYSKPIVTYSHTDPVLAPEPPPSVRGQFCVWGSCQRLYVVGFNQALSIRKHSLHVKPLSTAPTKQQ